MSTKIDWENAAQKVDMLLTFPDGTEKQCTGWVSAGSGLLYDDLQWEQMARYDGCTGTRPCGVEGCTNRTRNKGYSLCDVHQAEQQAAKLASRKRGRPQWQGEFPCWIEETFCADEDAVFCWADDHPEDAESEPTITEAVPQKFSEFSFMEQFGEDLVMEQFGEDLDGYDDELWPFKSPEAKALEAQVNAFLQSCCPKWYVQGSPYADGGFSAWWSERVEAVLSK